MDDLKARDPARAAVIKAMAEGRLTMPSANSRAPMARAYLRDVAAYDPEAMDESLMRSRRDTYRSATSGKIAQNFASFGTALRHMDMLDKAIDPLGSGNVTSINRLNQAIAGQYQGGQYGQLRQNLVTFEAARQGAVDELERAFRGSGGTQSGIDEWKKAINSADSPAALHSAVRAAMKMLGERMTEVTEQYNRGMAKKIPVGDDAL
jgi:hypothetical protein